MRQWTVRDVMTNAVLTVDADAPPAEIVDLITTYDVSTLAVVDDYDVVIGVLTRTDVLNAMTWDEVQPPSRLPWRRNRTGFGWKVPDARRMMSAPAVTIGPAVALAQAGRRMHRTGVKRLLVTDHRQRLLGIVAAADLLKVFGRPDDAIAAGVRAAVEPVTGAAVTVRAGSGVVTLTGPVRDRAAAGAVAAAARAVPGVTDVVSHVRVEAPAAPAARAAEPRRRPALDAWWVTRANEPERVPSTVS